MASIFSYAAIALILGAAVGADMLPDFLSTSHITAFEANWGVKNASVGVSIVTHGRPMFLDFALQQIKWQSMNPAEIVREISDAAKRTHETPMLLQVVVDDTPDDEAIQEMLLSCTLHGASFVHLSQRLSIGDKRNAAANLLRSSDVIAHWYVIQTLVQYRVQDECAFASGMTMTFTGQTAWRRKCGP